MTRLLILTFLGLTVLSCSHKKGGLDGNIRTLELTYITWACDCANWATKINLEQYSGDTLASKSIFIEPAHQDLELPDSLGYSNDVIKFTGQFYNKKGFPKGYHSNQAPKASRVFRYTDYEVVESNFRAYQDLESENE